MIPVPVVAHTDDSSPGGLRRWRGVCRMGDGMCQRRDRLVRLVVLSALAALMLPVFIPPRDGTARTASTSSPVAIDGYCTNLVDRVADESGDRVGGESVATPLLVRDGRAFVGDDATTCAGRIPEGSRAFLTVVATGEPGFRQHNSLVNRIDVTPGDAVAFTFFVSGLPAEAGRSSALLDAPARWAIASGEGGAIDATTGEMAVGASTPHGRVLVVRGEVDIAGRTHHREIGVLVYTPEANPFVGEWAEVARVACEDGAEIAPDRPIPFVGFWPDGRFRVARSWRGGNGILYLEEMYDGVYVYDLVGRTVTLVPHGDTEPPADFDGAGRFELDAAGNLFLGEVWLGAAEGSAAAPSCGHRLVDTG